MLSYDLKDLSLNKGISITLICFGTIVAPLWFIFQFTPSIFEKTDLVKLLLISAAIGIPLCLFNGILDFIKEQKDLEDAKSNSERTDKLLTLMAFSCIFSAFILYVPCIFSYWHKLSHGEAIRAAGYVQFGGIANQIVKMIFPKKDKSTKKQPIDKSEQNVINEISK